MRHGERHFDFEDVAERAETGVEQDVADLGDDFAPNDRSRAAAAARWSTAPSKMAALLRSRTIARRRPRPGKIWWTVAISSSSSRRSRSAISSIGHIVIDGTSSWTRCPVNFDNAAPARPKPMLISSISASCRTTEKIHLSRSGQRRVESNENVHPIERLVDKGGGARLASHVLRRRLDVRGPTTTRARGSGSRIFCE